MALVYLFAGKEGTNLAFYTRQRGLDEVKKKTVVDISDVSSRGFLIFMLSSAICRCVGFESQLTGVAVGRQGCTNQGDKNGQPSGEGALGLQVRFPLSLLFWS